MSEFLTHRSEEDFYGEWGVDLCGNQPVYWVPFEAPRQFDLHTGVDTAPQGSCLARAARLLPQRQRSTARSTAAVGAVPRDRHGDTVSLRKLGRPGEGVGGGLPKS